MVSDNISSDAAEIKKYQNGDMKAFTTLFKKYYPQVYRLLVFKGMTITEAEDATSEIFIRMIQTLKKYKHEKPLEHYIRHATRNKLIDYYRKTSRPMCNIDMVQIADNEESDFLPFEINKAINCCIRKIKNLKRRTVIIYWMEGFKRREIAKLLKIPLGSVHSHLERGKTKLQACIREELEWNTSA